MSDKKWLAAAGLAGALWMLPCAAPGVSEIWGVGVAHAAPADVAVLRVPRGGTMPVPMSNVSRVISADVDVVRGSFTSKGVVLEGVTVGSTSVDIVTRDGKRQKLSVQVVEPSKGAPAIVPAATAKPNAGATTPVSTGEAAPVAAPAPTQASSAPLAHAPQLSVSLRLETPQDNRGQALATVSYANRGDEAKGVVVRYTFDDTVSYVTDSATNGGHYDAAAGELSWQVGTLAPGASGQAKFRIAPIDPTTASLESVATIEDSSGVAVISETRTYYFSPAPLVAAFALPDRFLAGRNVAMPADMPSGEPGLAIRRLMDMGVISGPKPGSYQPNRQTKRAEYVIMTLNGINVRDLRDVSAIKFVLGRRAVVNLTIQDVSGKTVKTLAKNVTMDAGEQTKLWDGTGDNGNFVAPGIYTYVCSARDAVRSDTTRLQGKITVVSQTPLNPSGVPTFTDVKASDWYAGYLALAERQNIAQGYPDKTFQPNKAVSRVEATVILVRVLGLEDLAKQVANTDSGFFDYESIPKYARGHVNVATTLKTQGGKLIVGYPGNKYLPLKALRRDEAAIMVQRLIDKDGPRKMHISGQVAPGSRISLNGQIVQADEQGRFGFNFEQGEAPAIFAVLP